MSHSSPQGSKRYVLVRFSKNKFLFLFALIAAAGGILFFSSLIFPKSLPSFSGCWQSRETPEIHLNILPNQIQINDFLFSYELTPPFQKSADRENPQGFILDGRETGAVCGQFFFENGLLFLEVEGETKIFTPCNQSKTTLLPCVAFAATSPFAGNRHG